MSDTSRTFSESWHRVAYIKVSLRPTVRVRKQFFRGRKWYIIQDVFNNQFFRITPEAYYFVSRLSPDRTVEDVWSECVEKRPDDVPGQEAVINLLSQLNIANLLYFESPGDNPKLWERYQTRRQREIRSKFLSIMFFRIPLLDPEKFLKKISPLIELVFSRIGFAVWLLLVFSALKVVADNFDAAKSNVQGILDPSNLFLLYIGLIFIKTIHEFGHSFMCKRLGGEIHTMGVMLLIFTPMPYMDATSSWGFQNRWHRALVGAAGMIAELFIAALATFVWVNTGEGTLHSIAYNMMFIASVSTLIFNANPLLRFDGYYILSDLLDIPNLSTRATRHLKYIIEKYAFGIIDSESPALSKREAKWLTLFGIVSGIYKVLVFVGIIFFVADKFFLLGILMAMLCVVSWGIVPIFRFINYLAFSPKLVRTRIRAVNTTLSTFIIIIIFLAVCPFPNRFRAPGIIESKEYTKVINNAPGYGKELLVKSGEWVEAGTPVIVLSNNDIDFELTVAKAQRQEILARVKRARTMATANIRPIVKRLEAVNIKIENLEKQRDALVIKARHSGVWVSPEAEDMIGAWISRGTSIGEIVNNKEFRFAAVVDQDEAANLFIDQIRKAEVRIYGEAGIDIKVEDYRIIPFQHERLPSAALGWRGGGEVPVSLQDESGLKSAEPFFQIYADLKNNTVVSMFHNRTGKIRFSMKPRPLLFQWGSKFRRLLQKRYRI